MAPNRSADPIVENTPNSREWCSEGTNKTIGSKTPTMEAIAIKTWRNGAGAFEVGQRMMIQNHIIHFKKTVGGKPDREGPATIFEPGGESVLQSFRPSSEKRLLRKSRPHSPAEDFFKGTPHDHDSK